MPNTHVLDWEDAFADRWLLRHDRRRHLSAKRPLQPVKPAVRRRVRPGNWRPMITGHDCKENLAPESFYGLGLAVQ